MIIDAERHVDGVLNKTEITAVFGNKIYWELAPEDVKLPYLVYHLESEGPVTKDRLESYNIDIYIFDKTLTAAATGAKIIGNSISDNRYGWRSRGEKSGYVDTEVKEGYIQMNYNFKI